MGLISPGGQNLLDFLGLRQVLSTYDGDLRDRLWWPQHKGFAVVNKAEVDIFLKLSCFFDDPVDVDNLISGSSAFSKSSLNIWKFMIHVLLKTWRILSITLLACEMSAIVQ